MAPKLMSQERIDYLLPRIVLAEAKYIGPRYARLFLERMGSIDAIFSGVESLRKAFPRQKERLINELYNRDLWIRAERVARWCVDNEVRVYFVGDEDYPYRLFQCVDAPVVLYSKGDYSAWNKDSSVSVVGTRNITTYGEMMTDRILRELSQIAPTTAIVSGLAYGVDITAHRKALDLGLPTVCVLAHGFDRIYPSTHYQLAHQILANGGAWLSEYPVGIKPERFNFVARNRIIAGLTDSTIVIEAGLKSGSLITANLARDYDREVLAVPGRVGDKYSEGTNLLISNMTASLVTSGADVARLMGWESRERVIQSELDFGTGGAPLENPVYRLISELQPIHQNDVVRRTGMTVSEVSAILFDLELDGHIKAMPGGVFTLSR